VEKSRRRILQGGLGLAAALGSACGRQDSPAVQQPSTPAPGSVAPPAPTTGVDFQVAIRFAGLFALVAKDDYKMAQVLLLNAKKVLLPEHFPRLRIRKDRVANPSKPDFVDSAEPDTWIFDLASCHVTFTGLSGDTTMGPTTATQCPETEEEWKDPRFITDMKHAIKMDAVANPDYVSKGPDGKTPVASRITLAGGAIEAAIPSIPRYQKAAFDYGDKKNLPITDQVQFLSTKISALTIVRTLPDSTKRDDIVLKAPADASTPVYLWIQNHVLPGTHVDPDLKHFKGLYKFTKKGSGNKLPEKARLCKGGPLPDFPVYCPPARLYYE
jgi:hypothetical protein